MFFKKKYNYTCQARGRNFRDNPYTDEKMVEIVTSSHGKLCLNILENISSLTQKAKISGNNEVPIKSTHDLGFSHSYYTKFSSVFNQQILELTKDSIINNEIQYIKAQENYAQFMASPFYNEIKNSLESALANGISLYTGGKLFQEDIAVCRVKEADAGAYFEPNNYHNNFELRLISSSYDFDYGCNYNACISCKQAYRRLSPLETSMLSIAIAEAFPQHFSVEWNLHITAIAHQDWKFDFHLIPKWIYISRKRNISTSLKDIY